MLSTLPRPKDDEYIEVVVKTPLSPKATSARMPSGLSLNESIKHFISQSPKDANAARVLQHLLRELQETHHFLAVTPKGVERVEDPSKTRLADIAIPREIRTNDGIDLVKVASFEVQSYAKVG